MFIVIWDSFSKDNMADNNLSERIQAVKEITALFRVERLVYVTSIIVCLIILLISVTIALIKNEFSSGELTSMFGSGGVITFMTGRLLHMWNRAINLLDNPDKESGKNEW